MKKIVLVLVLSFFAVALSAAPVRLQFAQDVSFVLANARVIHQVTGQVEVENLAYEKSVDVFYTLDGVAWQSTEACYENSLASGKDVFTFAICLPESDYNNGVYASRAVRFAVRYRVAGQTFWDNNGGPDYTVATMGDNRQAPRLVLGSAAVRLMGVRCSPAGGSPDGWVFEGRVALRNLGFQKQVNIVYTTDDWATTRVTVAWYNGVLEDGLEVWVFSVAANHAVPPKHEFAISYAVNGQTAWDNNAGRNFILEAGSWIWMSIW
jgi:hypothetical protein